MDGTKGTDGLRVIRVWVKGDGSDAVRACMAKGLGRVSVERVTNASDFGPIAVVMVRDTDGNRTRVVEWFNDEGNQSPPFNVGTCYTFTFPAERIDWDA